MANQLLSKSAVSKINLMKTRQKLIASAVKFTCLFAGVLTGLIQTASAQLTIQIVNDSGLEDSNIYVMVPGAGGATISPTNLFVDKNVGANTSIALSTLATNGFGTSSIVSPVSGNTNTVHYFQVSYITSGGIYFIYNKPFTFTNGVTPSPPANSVGNDYRYDYAELSFLGGNVNNDVDLTYVDKFGIPLQLEWFNGSNTAATNLIAGSYVYASTKTLANIFSGNGFSNAVYGLDNASNNIDPGWTYTNSGSYTNFARILAPQKISLPSPYPDIANYLDFLTTNPFVLNGYSVQGTNFYLGYQVSVRKTSDPVTGIAEWFFTMAYNSNSVPPYNLSLLGATNIQQQYTNTITFAVPAVTVVTNPVISTNSESVVVTNIYFITNNADVNAYVYGSPVGPGIYSVNGAPVTGTNSGSYAVESWMIGDVFSAINFGFAGGIYGTNSDQWFSPDVAWPDPYGWAQPSARNNPAAGYYNAYAALMYYNADAYSYAFSERITPDVGLPVRSNDVVRITILPDDRLDSPAVSVPANLITPNSITLDWNAVPNATGYQVNVLRPAGIAPVNISTNNYTLNGLSSGTPYVISVQATGVNAINGNPLITPARPVYATTTGMYSSVTGGTIPVLFSLNATDPFSQLGSLAFNGNIVTGWTNNMSTTIPYNSVVGTNEVLVTLTDNNKNIVFNDWLQFVVASLFSVTNYGTNMPDGSSVSFVSSNSAISGVTLGGQLIGSPAPTISGGWPMGGVGPVLAPADIHAIWVTNYTGNATNFLVSVNGSSVTGNPGPTIGLAYDPAEIRQLAPTTAIAPPPATGVTITGVTTLTGGGLQFNFNVPTGTNYVVESTTNLLSGTWQTNASGTGQSSGESYTNTAGASAAQFYRIKM